MKRLRITKALCAATMFTAGCGETPEPQVTLSSSGGDASNPTLVLSVEGNPAFLAGTVSVRAEANPAASFRGVEFRAGGKTFATDLEAPFEQPFDSTGAPDGPIQIQALGFLQNSVDSIQATIDTEVANVAPQVSVISPMNNEILLTRDPASLTISPVVQAADGNGIEGIFFESESGLVDLGSGDGSISIPLAVGKDFPHAAVKLRFFAIDRSGMETSVEVPIVPSVTNQEFSLVGGGPAVSQFDVLDDGSGLLGLGSVNGYTPHIYIFSQPPLESAVIDSIDGTSLFDRVGSNFVYRRNEKVEIRFSDGMTKALLATSSALKQYLRFGPIVRSPDRIYGAFFDVNGDASHLMSFDGQGNLLVDKVFPGEVLGYELLVLPNGRLLVELGPVNGSIVTTLLDPDTLEKLGTWPGTNYRILWQDPSLVLATCSNGGAKLRAIGMPGENVLFEYPLAQSYITAIRRTAAGSFLFADVMGDYFRADMTGLTTSSTDRFIGWFAGSDDALVVIQDVPNSTTATFQRMKSDGSIVWSKSMTVGKYGSGSTDIVDGGWLWLHGNGFNDESIPTKLTTFSDSGEQQWERSFAANQVHRLQKIDDRLFVPYSQSGGSTFVYESLWPQNGETIFRYVEPMCSGSYASASLWKIPQWQALFGTIVPEDAASMKMIGFLP